MSSILLIHNPIAARTSASALRSICKLFKSAGWDVTTADVIGERDAEEFARTGVASGVKVVAVYGGDGTTIQAVAGMLGSDAVLGLIPGGTGNLLANNLRLPRNPVRAAQVIVQGAPKPVDLGRLTCGGAVRHFGVGCGAGIDADIMTASEEAKRRFGMAAYVAKTVEVLGRIRSVPYRVTVDGRTLEVEAASVLVVNCGEVIRPILRLRSGISLDDGLLDVVVLSANGVMDSFGVVWHMVSGRPSRAGRVQYAQGRVVRVEADEPRLVEMDGEPVGKTPFTAEAVPGGVNVLMPRTA